MTQNWLHLLNHCHGNKRTSWQPIVFMCHPNKKHVPSRSC